MRTKFSLQANHALLLLTAYFTFILNIAFFQYVFDHVTIDSTRAYVFLASVIVLIFCVQFILFSLFFWRPLGKPLFIVLLLISGAANFFMARLGAFIDTDMVRSVFQSNVRETSDMLTFSFFVWFLLGLIPAIILARTQIISAFFWQSLKARLKIMALALLAIVLIAAIFYKDYASFGRNNQAVMRLLNPSNYIYATVRYFQKKIPKDTTLKKLDGQALHQPFPDDKKTVLILIVGETARSMNFSLNGYARQTNPKLATQNVISFASVASAGTSTAVSVPCMFSHLNRSDCNPDQAKYTENVLELLQNVGYKIWWRDNDDGCKDVCNRLPTELIDRNSAKNKASGFCDQEACFDDILLDGLEERLKNIQQDTVIVLHTIGSHGPSYFQRYPKEFRAFTPTCDTAEIRTCSNEEIVNTYDNTILYTDHIVSSAIDILKKFPDYESSLLYVSDHGESLGENGLYLHAVPYLAAPKEQTQVPMVLWMSKVMQKEDFIDEACMRQFAKEKAISHDYLFHSLLGLLEVNSKHYDEKLDFFASCRTKALPFTAAKK